MKRSILALFGERELLHMAVPLMGHPTLKKKLDPYEDHFHTQAMR